MNVEAFDWNCPEHITPRCTMDEVRQMIAPMNQDIAKSEEEIKRLKER